MKRAVERSEQSSEASSRTKQAGERSGLAAGERSEQASRRLHCLPASTVGHVHLALHTSKTDVGDRWLEPSFLGIGPSYIRRTRSCRGAEGCGLLEVCCPSLRPTVCVHVLTCCLPPRATGTVFLFDLKIISISGITTARHHPPRPRRSCVGHLCVSPSVSRVSADVRGSPAHRLWADCPTSIR